MRYICIHGHFYQPPRENPWLEEVELQDSAYPHHDWNKRIASECYAPNTASRILDGGKKVVNIINNYSKISFNFGPTLLSWMERHKPNVYKHILSADRESMKHFSGHGSALAQAYNHLIMPLASSRDKRTQVIWGIHDFKHRFNRAPEGMWLPETAVDFETLELLVEHDIRFTILSPSQASRVRKIGEKRWRDAKGGRIDPKFPYLCTLPSGRTISLFFYDEHVSRDLAFGNLLDNAENFANRLMSLLSPDPDTPPHIAHIACDGETYGHHHPYGDMALAYCLNLIESNPDVNLTIYGEFLEKYPPAHEVEIFENSSWSCIHGIERWKENCGCNSGMKPGWHQKWRAPLRQALDTLRDKLADVYEKQLSPLVRDPWQMRDAYIAVLLNRSTENIELFLAERAQKELSLNEKSHILKLLEMQRHLMLMYTSCGWFFDEISGIETVQIIQYAARAMQLAKEITRIDYEPEFIKLLEQAPGNTPKLVHGGAVYTEFVKPGVLDLLRIGAHYAVSSLFKEYPKDTSIYSYTATNLAYNRYEAGNQKVVVGQARIKSNITWEETNMSYAVLNFGGHNVTGGVREYQGTEAFEEMHTSIKDAFTKSDISKIMYLIDAHCGPHHYSLWHLLKDDQRMIVNQILEASLREVEYSFKKINEQYYPVMKVIKGMHMPLPKSLNTTFEFILNKDLQAAIDNGKPDLKQLQNLVGQVEKWDFNIDKTTLSFAASTKINTLMKAFSEKPADVSPLEDIIGILDAVKPLYLKLDIWKSQNIYFSVTKQLFGKMQDRAAHNDESATRWVSFLEDIGTRLNIRIAWNGNNGS